MNWNTRNVVKGQSINKLQKLLAEDGGCEHVEADINLAYAIRRENDSFGTVGSYLVCEACDKKENEEEGQVEHVCSDCKQTHLAKDGIAWKWYDFYAAQGDEPTHICNKCKVLPTHQQRVAQDQADYDREFGIERDDEECAVAYSISSGGTGIVNFSGKTEPKDGPPDIVQFTAALEKSKNVTYFPQEGTTLTLVSNEYHQKALSKLAIYWLKSRDLGTEANWHIAMLLDNAIELELRTTGPHGMFLSIEDCPVLAKRPDDQDLAAKIYRFIPFVNGVGYSAYENKPK